jgi:uncharacterized repeat protein (TIGR03803 family)
VLLAALAILAPSPSAAQATSYGVIYSFKGKPDGANPRAAVIIDKDGALYGTTYVGGASGLGTVFELTKAAGQPWSETVLHSFSGPDGSNPRANVVFGSKALYGTTATDSGNAGTVFELAPPSVAGSAWTESVLYAFAGGGGNILDGALLISPSGTLYTTTQGNTLPGGTVVSLAPPAVPGGSWTESVIYRFVGGAGGAAGSNPYAGLVSEGGALYGTDYANGDEYCQCGVVYELTAPAPQGGAWTETTIHTFGTSPGDGASPLAALTVGPGGVLYGTTVTGGTEVCATTGFVEGCGTVFQLTPPTTPGGAWTESVIYNFTGANGDGAGPVSSVVVGHNGEIYGTTQYGGSTDAACPATYDNLGGCGTVFELTPPAAPGGAWTENVLHVFSGQNGDGSQPVAGLALSSTGTLYGTTSDGGAGAGTVFAIMP